MGASECESCLGVLRRAERAWMKAFLCVTCFTAVRIWSTLELTGMRIDVTINARQFLQFVDGILARRFVAFPTLEGGVFPFQPERALLMHVLGK